MSDNHNKNTVVWTDIPVVDLLRAAEFYDVVLDREVEITELDELAFAAIQSANGNGVCLYPDSDYVASEKGPLVYLNVEGRLKDAVAQCKKYGGEVVEDIRDIGNFGQRAVIKDCDGTRIALHSTN